MRVAFSMTLFVIVRFRHVESGARIDLDVGRMEGGEFRVWVFGFPKSG